MASTSRRRRSLLAVVGAVVLVLTMTLSASAAMYSQERYSGADAFSYDDCGSIVDVSVEFGGIFQIRTGTGDDANAFFAHDNYWYRETHVRRFDGKTLVVSGNGNFKETKAARVEGSIFTFTSTNAGQLFTIRDGDGRVLLRDRGSITETILFDTTGDDVPGGEFIEILDTTFHGQFPSLDADFCAIWSD
jgi:hypothetical protein